MLLLVFIDNPDNNLIIGGLLLWGLALAGFNALSVYLVDKHAPPDHRGKAHGVQTIFAVAGALMCTHLGGYLLDEWTRHAPFLLFCGASLLVLAILFLIALTKKSSETLLGDEKNVSNLRIPFCVETQGHL
eukprot:TRINITY_DN10717_c0_g1_i1.p1 TRINITY_DN10717_c0_g1~~TRINITY_DN10717_c0_g1_i1.p1  ORF type:complete len:131 (+),score=19.16 TRINITY_DN10717_c0_g1_i1:488-880(+)